ncbi:hypothetical protein [Moraxella lacunata]|uniref:hypothetical protein n=1 Tax=Moraxella lacunata TaxID=477 RepID=UPI003EDE8218
MNSIFNARPYVYVIKLDCGNLKIYIKVKNEPKITPNFRRHTRICQSRLTSPN